MEAPAEPGGCMAESGDPCRCVAPDLVPWDSSLWSCHLAPAYTVEGFIQSEKKNSKVIHEVKISPFPITPKGKQSLPGLRLVLHHCCLCAFLRASASADCSGLQSVSRLLLAGDSAICELHWRDCELCVSTFNVHQAPISFVRPVASSVILIASTFQVQLQLQAVMLQGCP